MKRFLIAAGLSLMLSLPSAAFAATTQMDANDFGEGYAEPTYRDMIQSIVMMGGVDITKPHVVDAYAKLFYCDLYKKNFSDDFEWNNIRRKISAKVLEKRDSYRLQYEIYGTLTLGRYNFEGQFFPVIEGTEMANVNSVKVIERENFLSYCHPPTGIREVFPPNIKLHLNQPITVTTLKIPMDEARRLLDRIKEKGSSARNVFLRIRFKATGVPTMVTLTGALMTEDTASTPQRINVRGYIKSLDVFLDKEMTHWLTSVPINVAGK